MTGRDGLLRTAVAGGLAAVAARGAYLLLTRKPPGGAATWARTNHRGEQLTLLEGPALAAGAVLAAAVTPGLPPRARAAMMTAAAGAAACGGYDDLAGSGDRRGFRGHLGALAHGELTTGAVKLGGIGAAGLAASGLLGGPAADVLVNAGLIAGSANLVNLFDLRPGRAIKVAVAGGLLAAVPGSGSARRRGFSPGSAGAGIAAGASGAPLPTAALTALPLGAALALAGEDLGERAMLGDAGANALGALLGTVAAASLGRPARLALLAGITGLTAASEVVSFTRVIERTPPLRWLDMLGRRPPAPAASGSAATSGQAVNPGQAGTAAAPGAGAAGPGPQAPVTPG